MAALQPFHRSQSFPEDCGSHFNLESTNRRSSAKAQNTTFQPLLLHRSVGTTDPMMQGLSLKYPEIHLQPVPPIIQECSSDLIQDSSSPDVASWNTNHAATAPFKGRGVPSTLNLPPFMKEPSEITDRGDQMYINLKIQGRVDSFPADKDDGEGTLADQLFGVTKENSRDRTDFLPKRQLDRLINPQSVTKELTRWLRDTISEDKIKDLACQVCSETLLPSNDVAASELKVISYQKVFAILVLVNKVYYIEKFLQEQVCDIDLPLARHVEQNGDCRKISLHRRKQPKVRLGCFDTWSQINLRNFEQYQWSVIPPFFTKGQRKNVKHYVFEPHIVLPFSFSNDMYSVPVGQERRGGYSLVFQAEIHPDHHDFNGSEGVTEKTSQDCRNIFAIKCLDSPDKDSFEKEVHILKRFSGEAHPHLISLLSTYEKAGKYFLIFPWAGADLKTYWKTENPMPAFDADTVIWMAEQCKGIAEGLTKLHQYETDRIDKGQNMKNEHLTPHQDQKSTRGPEPLATLYGRHGDIKPENILWFPGPRNSKHQGTLKISDFGLAELNTRQSRSNRRGSQVANSPTYRPPECDLQKKLVKQAYDIWTLGCLYLEFVTWMLGGWALLNEFRSQRQSTDAGPRYIKSDSFFEIWHSQGTKQGQASVKVAVRQFILKLHSHARCTEFFHRFLHLIEEDMMAIEAMDRPRCMQIQERLTSWHDRCLNDEEFALMPAPWSN
ncbi:protein kinase [Colletotrichum truncatum]|uniref:Protein kinase n=1 Tax=Colletotrichum truncatum TaxID=5467 RepID=A0ACC3YDJ6_COLTU|nr:protein kinase [Colletotrichum truncatum]KAF6784846.1 protein kinase [Colletotrichum truncatum]